jgi:hypothetical protein
MVLTKHVYLRRKKYKMHMIQDAPTAMGVSLWCYFCACASSLESEKKAQEFRRCRSLSLGDAEKEDDVDPQPVGPGRARLHTGGDVNGCQSLRSPFTPSPKASRRWPWTSSGTEAATLPTAMPRTVLALVCKLYRRRSGRGNTA